MTYLNKILYQLLKLLPQSIVKIFSRRYIAGFNFNETIEICKNLNSQGFLLTLDILGEHTKTQAEAEKVTHMYQNLLKAIHTDKIKANISIKPTHIGCDISFSLFENNLKILADTAKRYSNFI